MTRHKHADVIHAWAEGAEIQSLHDDGWHDDFDTPDWFEDVEYRIKPRTVKREGYAILFKGQNGLHFVGQYVYDEDGVGAVQGEKIAVAKFEWEE